MWVYYCIKRVEFILVGSFTEACDCRFFFFLLFQYKSMCYQDLFL